MNLDPLDLVTESCGDVTVTTMYAMGDDTFLISREGEVSLADGETLLAFLKDLRKE